MIDMQIEPFLVASTVNVIIGQRLVRKICEMCKASVSINRTELLQNLSETVVAKHFGDTPDVRIYKGKGCKICHGTGYTGRLGVFEVLEVTKAIKAILAGKVDADMILNKALEEGMTTMLDDGLVKVVSGMTTIEEVLRVTKVEGL
jgi:type II secretory ATPase GspE/PulE/Tfp pilus assembly ATPase PilB-like protein